MPLIIPILHKTERWMDALVILDEESTDRIAKADPLTVSVEDLLGRHPGFRLRGIGVTYVDEQDRSAIVSLMRQGKEGPDDGRAMVPLLGVRAQG